MVKANPISIGHREKRLARAILIIMDMVRMIIGMLGDKTKSIMTTNTKAAITAKYPV